MLFVYCNRHEIKFILSYLILTSNHCKSRFICANYAIINAYRWVSAKKTWLQCVSNGVTSCTSPSISKANSKAFSYVFPYIFMSLWLVQLRKYIKKSNYSFRALVCFNVIIFDAHSKYNLRGVIAHRPRVVTRIHADTKKNITLRCRLLGSFMLHRHRWLAITTYM